MSEHIADLYNEYRAALLVLQDLAGDLSPAGDELFRKWQRRCRELKDQIWYAEQREDRQAR